jgi:hypothetical protein
VPRTVIAAPLFGQAVHLPAALDSLLAQTERDFALVLVDDASPDASAAVARRYAALDARVTVHENARRLGMLLNTRRAYALARELHPEAEFWALGSDHDLWDPRWLERLLEALDAHPAAALAYPLSARIDAQGRQLAGLRPLRCDTSGIADPWRRLRVAYRAMVAGDMIYGLFRTAPLDRVGFYRSVLVPDRLLLAELALEGEFVQVREPLWRRRFAGLADLERQRRAFWPAGDAPASARAPWWVVHAAVGAQARGGRFGWALAREGARLRAVRRLQALRRRIGAALEPPTRAALRRRRLRALAADGRLPVPADTQEVLERLLAETASPPGREDPAPR